MDAYKLLVVLIFPFQHVVATVNLTDFLHHLVHVAYIFLSLCHGFGSEAPLSEVFAEIFGKRNVFVFLLVEVGIEFCKYRFVALTEVVINNLQFFLHSLTELKVNH